MSVKTYGVNWKYCVTDYLNPFLCILVSKGTFFFASGGLDEPGHECLAKRRGSALIKDSADLNSTGNGAIINTVVTYNTQER